MFVPLFLCDVCPNMHPTYLLIDQMPGCCLFLPHLLLGHPHLASLPALGCFPIPSHSYSQKLPSPAQVRDSSLSTKSGEQARERGDDIWSQKTVLLWRRKSHSMGGHQNNTKQGEEQGEVARRTPWLPLSWNRESFLNNHSVSPRLGAGIEIWVGNSPATWNSTQKKQNRQEAVAWTPRRDFKSPVEGLVAGKTKPERQRGPLQTLDKEKEL